MKITCKEAFKSHCNAYLRQKKAKIQLMEEKKKEQFSNPPLLFFLLFLDLGGGFFLIFLPACQQFQMASLLCKMSLSSRCELRTQFLCLPSVNELSNTENHRESTLVRLLDFTSEVRLGAISLRPFFMIPAFVFLDTVSDERNKTRSHESNRLTPLATMGFDSFLIP